MSFLIGNLSLGTFDIELIPGCLIPSLCFIQHDFIKSSVYFKSLGNIYVRGNLAVSNFRKMSLPTYEIQIKDYGYRKFNKKIHIMEQNL